MIPRATSKRKPVFHPNKLLATLVRFFRGDCQAIIFAEYISNKTSRSCSAFVKNNLVFFRNKPIGFPFQIHIKRFRYIRVMIYNLRCIFCNNQSVGSVKLCLIDIHDSVCCFYPHPVPQHEVIKWFSFVFIGYFRPLKHCSMALRTNNMIFVIPMRRTAGLLPLVPAMGAAVSHFFFSPDPCAAQQNRRIQCVLSDVGPSRIVIHHFRYALCKVCFLCH